MAVLNSYLNSTSYSWEVALILGAAVPSPGKAGDITPSEGGGARETAQLLGEIRSVHSHLQSSHLPFGSPVLTAASRNCPNELDTNERRRPGNTSAVTAALDQKGLENPTNSAAKGCSRASPSFN